MVGHFEMDWHIVRKTSCYGEWDSDSEPGLLLDRESEAYNSSASNASEALKLFKVDTQLRHLMCSGITSGNRRVRRD